MTFLIKNPKLKLDSNILLSSHLPADQVEADHHGVGQPAALPVHPELERQVPLCTDPIHVDYEWFGLDAILLAGFHLGSIRK